MSLPVSPLHLGRFDALTAPQRQAVLDRALALQHEAPAGGGRRLLLGRNIGLLSDGPASADAALFSRAAVGLGARVAHVRAVAADLEGEEALHSMARMLGRLYDAIECEGLPSAVVERLRSLAGVPVYDSLGSVSHPSAALAVQLDSGAITDESRRCVIQAVLLASLAGG